MASVSQAGALVSKGGAALGTDFRIGGFTNYNPASNYSTFLSVMASENTTSITINNINTGVDILDFDEAALGVSLTGTLNDISFNAKSRRELHHCYTIGSRGRCGCGNRSKSKSNNEF